MSAFKVLGKEEFKCKAINVAIFIYNLNTDTTLWSIVIIVVIIIAFRENAILDAAHVVEIHMGNTQWENYTEGTPDEILARANTNINNSISSCW